MAFEGGFAVAVIVEMKTPRVFLYSKRNAMHVM